MTGPKKIYVCGILFSTDLKAVMLYKKGSGLFPDRLNGFGGGIDVTNTDTPISILARNALRGSLQSALETSAEVNWEAFADLSGYNEDSEQFIVKFYRAKMGQDFTRAKELKPQGALTLVYLEDDNLSAPSWKARLAKHLDWLIPLARANVISAQVLEYRTM